MRGTYISYSGLGKDGKPIRFRVLLDGAAPLDDHGADVDGQGNGDGEGIPSLPIDPAKGQSRGPHVSNRVS